MIGFPTKSIAAIWKIIVDWEGDQRDRGVVVFKMGLP